MKFYSIETIETILSASHCHFSLNIDFVVVVALFYTINCDDGINLKSFINNKENTHKIFTFNGRCKFQRKKNTTNASEAKIFHSRIIVLINKHCDGTVGLVNATKKQLKCRHLDTASVFPTKCIISNPNFDCFDLRFTFTRSLGVQLALKRPKLYKFYTGKYELNNANALIEQIALFVCSPPAFGLIYSFC